MRITAYTNVLLRAVLDDNEAQHKAAIDALERAELVAISARMLRAGGDFADGVVAHEGSWLGGETFVSFDKKAVALLGKQGRRTRLLAS